MIYLRYFPVLSVKFVIFPFLLANVQIMSDLIEFHLKIFFWEVALPN